VGRGWSANHNYTSDDNYFYNYDNHDNHNNGSSHDHNYCTSKSY
jgi:hypothetical protein